MKIIGTPSELQKLFKKCRNTTYTCKECVINDFCCRELFISKTEAELDSFVTGHNIDINKLPIMLIQKGDGQYGKGGNQQNS